LCDPASGAILPGSQAQGSAVGNEGATAGTEFLSSRNRYVPEVKLDNL